MSAYHASGNGRVRLDLNLSKSVAVLKILIRELLVAFPNWHVTIEDIFAQDNKVVTRWSLTATHLASYHDIPATGLKIHAEGIHIDDIVDDKIAKSGRATILPRSSIN